MRNPAKAILVAVLIAIPAPFILGLLLTTTPDPLRLLAIGEGLEALGASGGIASQPANTYDDDEDDFDDSTPEGNEEGTVKWFNVKKGFGFIVRDSGDEIFVHFRAIRGRGRRVLRQGQLVRFNVVEADKGLQADNVSILSE